MDVNKFIHLATLQTPANTVTAKGDQTVTYVDDGIVACRIEPLSGRELFWAKQLRADLTHKITLMFTSRITHRHRMKWNGRTFELGPPISPEEEKLWMQFTAIEVK